MALPRPRSLTSLLTVGLVVVALPFMAAVVHGGLQLRQLSRESDALVRESVEVARNNQALFQYLASMERSASLYGVLGKPDLITAYRASHTEFTGRLVALDALQQEPSTRDRIRALMTLADGTRGDLETSGQMTPERAARLSTRFQDLNEQVNGLARATAAAVDKRLADIEDRSDTAQRMLFWTLALFVPVAIIFGGLFTYVVLKPLRQIDQAISELGRGTFSRPVYVDGPTDLQALGRQLEWLRMRLIELAHEKNRFLRHMSHELKTPLANIREGTDLLLEGAVGPLDEHQREVMSILRENALALQRLIENLLSYSAWQSQAVGLELSEVPLRTLVKAVVDGQRLALVAQRIKLDIALEDLTLTADRGKLRLVLDNLLSNALKFTPRSGSIHIRARSEQDQVVIDFADSGPGIPRDERTRIFEAFYSGGGAQAGPLRGTGIGLSVVLEFVQAHRGSIEIVDGEFPGAHFRIRLPLRQAPGHPEETARAA